MSVVQNQILVKAQAAVEYNVELRTFRKDIVYHHWFYGFGAVWFSSPLSYCFKQILEGATVQKASARNKVHLKGLRYMGDFMIGATSKSITHCGVGSSNAAIDTSHTDLTSPISSRHSINYRYSVGDAQSKFDTFYGDQENNGTWNETALFTGDQAYPTDIMLARLLVQQPSGFTKDATLTAVIAWTITLTAV